MWEAVGGCQMQWGVMGGFEGQWSMWLDLRDVGGCGWIWIS